MGSDFAHVGLGSPNVDQLIVRLGGNTVGAPDAQASLVSPALETQLVAAGTTPIEVPADGTSKGYVVVTLLDVDRHTVAGRTVTLAGNPSGAVTITPASGVSDDHGEVVFTVTNATAQDVIFTATADGTPLAMRRTIPFAVPTAAAGGIVASPPTVAADGIAVATISVTLRDALGRPTPGKEVRLSQGTGHSLITAPSPSVTGANGQIDFTASNLVNETVTYTAVDVTDDELPVPGSPQVTFNGGSGAPAASR